MGKQGQCKAAGGSKTYVLKLDMHCQCNGCVKKMRDAVKEMMSLSQGVERADVSAEAEAGEVSVEVTGGIDMDPVKLCCLLQEATKKKRVRIAEEASVPSSGQGQAEAAGGWRRDGAGTFPTTVPIPSAPPAPEEEAEAWSETTAPSERCRYRWAAPGSTVGVWAASDITGTLAMLYHHHL